MFPVWLQAGFWGLVGGSALLLGAAVGYFVSIPQRAIAKILGGAAVYTAANWFLSQQGAKHRKRSGTRAPS
jgi:ZIP family zinc transporter